MSLSERLCGVIAPRRSPVRARLAPISKFRIEPEIELPDMVAAVGVRQAVSDQPSSRGQDSPRKDDRLSNGARFPVTELTVGKRTRRRRCLRWRPQRRLVARARGPLGCACASTSEDNGRSPELRSGLALVLTPGAWSRRPQACAPSSQGRFASQSRLARIVVVPTIW